MGPHPNRIAKRTLPAHDAASRVLGERRATPRLFPYRRRSGGMERAPSLIGLRQRCGVSAAHRSKEGTMKFAYRALIAVAVFAVAALSLAQDASNAPATS